MKAFEIGLSRNKSKAGRPLRNGRATLPVGWKGEIARKGLIDRMRNNMKLNNNQAVFWCGNEADFIRMKEVMADPEIWPETYAEFVTGGEELIAEAGKKGLLLTKIEADPDAFVAWCKIEGCKPDRMARIMYAVQQFDRLPKNTN